MTLCNCGFSASGHSWSEDSIRAHKADFPRACIEFQKGRIQAMEQTMREFDQLVQEARDASQAAIKLLKARRAIGLLMKEVERLHLRVDDDREIVEEWAKRAAYRAVEEAMNAKEGPP